MTKRNIDQIAELFPQVITETLDSEGNLRRAVDFDLLRQELSDHIVEGPHERYQLDWPGKRTSAFAANAPIAKTLRPVREESVDFDTTKNIFIEGDNLDALKLLQESYLGKIKLIYIDPPYNTGNDFIYRDDFSESNEEYLKRSGQKSDAGERLVANTGTSGRFHSDWLSMMHPRLKLARNLLTPGGLIFISIDEGEASALKLMCDEIFGHDNFVEQFAWKNKYGGGALSRGIANVHEYVLVYSRTPIESLAAPLDEDQRASYKLQDEKFARRGGFITQPLATRSKDPRPNLVYPIEWEKREVWPDKQWVWSRERVEQARENNEIVFSEANGKTSVRVKQYLRDESGVERLGKPVSVLIGPYNQAGTRDLETLFDTKVFDFPKPVALIKYFASFVVNGDTEQGFITLDFFAGSGSAAHAIMQLNAEDGGQRQFIAVQAPEVTPPSSEARRAGFETIAELSRERIRRAGAQIRADSGRRLGDLLDTGFRSFRVDMTNMAEVHTSPDLTAQSELPYHVDSIKPGRSADDLVFQVMLDWGLELSLPIEHERVASHELLTVGEYALIACFVDEVSDDIVRAIAKRNPLRVVFRDSGFANDAARINTEQILRELSPETEVRVI
ncbi:site-specific DNA-methyltransferase [Ferrimicrobium sp.]|uniref:site-specific DNA-methyltransferase n=1 Tax=Ferrimicrobium sp. TaxID=2926050 RepID=UPI0026340397|nr:site-specific DNA-methyltransferase [Ferrimicrobium sp.]